MYCHRKRYLYGTKGTNNLMVIVMDGILMKTFELCAVFMDGIHVLILCLV